MLDQVRALLDLSRMSGEAGLSRSALRVDRLLEDAKDIQAWDSLASRVQVGRQMLTCPRIDADAQIVRRVLENLISNSVKHNVAGTTILLDACLAKNGTEVIFTCTDDGRGIPDEFLPRLFAEYETDGEESSTDSTGLGLAFCRKAVEAHGGRIWYERTDGSGARFCFTLPVAKEGDRCSVAS